MNWKEWADDKTQVIVAVTVLTIIAVVALPESAGNYLDAAFAGLFGLAVGSKLK